MSNYKLEVIEGGAQIREFNELPKRIYKGNRNWVCPLTVDIERVFDPTKNGMFVDGDAIRWLVRDGSGQVVGRVAAFYNQDVASINEQPTGGCGFFESIDDQRVANMLFDASKEWLQERGMEAMDGPINFGDRDNWWGLLVEGYELQPLYMCNYNPPYYKNLFENYGFKNYFNQHTYLRNITPGELGKSVYERVKRLDETPGYRFEHIAKSNMTQVADDFRMVYNKAWASFTGVKPMDKEHAHALLKQMRPIMDERLVYFGYFNNEPIGFFIMVPDLNRIIGRFNGKLNWINKIRLIAMLKLTRKADRISGIIFGVVPEFHGKGVESGMVYAFEHMVVASKELHYKSLELMWVGDFNPVMMRMVENYVCAQKHKLHTTYRYLFDQNKPFTRHPRMGAKKR